MPELRMDRCHLQVFLLHLQIMDLGLHNLNFPEVLGLFLIGTYGDRRHILVADMVNGRSLAFGLDNVFNLLTFGIVSSIAVFHL